MQRWMDLGLHSWFTFVLETEGGSRVFCISHYYVALELQRLSFDDEQLEIVKYYMIIASLDCKVRGDEHGLGSVFHWGWTRALGEACFG